MRISLSAAARQAATGGDAAQELTAQETARVRELQARDTEVRAHEAAHAAASGGLGGAPSFEYATGPDGRRYAVGGEVSVDTSGGRTPEETIAKARTIRAAATAPADPSAQDMAVAASAARMEADAQRALQELRQIAAENPDEATPAAAPATAAAKEHEGEMVLATLVREQIAARGGGSHTHLESDCGFCRKALTQYL